MGLLTMAYESNSALHLFLYNLQAEDDSYFLNGWKKIERRIIFCDLKN